MERALIGFACGAVGGALSGFLLSLFVSWGKDLRDERLRAARVPLPSDRVFVPYHWPFAGLGAFQGAFLVLALDISPVSGALPVLAVPALYLPFLGLSALFTWLSPSRRPRRFNPETLVDRDIAEAESILLKEGWSYEVIEERAGEPAIGPARYRSRSPPHVELSVRDGRVTGAVLVE